MNIFASKGEFVFINNKYEKVEYNNFFDIPEDLSEFIELVTFVPEIPPAPHTVQEHELIHSWMRKFEETYQKIYASRN